MNDAEKRFWLEGATTRFEEIEKRLSKLEREKK